MQKLFKPKASLEEYYQQGKSYDFPDLSKTLCPHCKKSRLKKHGFYQRYHITVHFCKQIQVRRHYCDSCGRTVSSIPFFCHPRRTYGTEFIMGVLKSFYSKTQNINQCLENLIEIERIDCSRQLLYQFRKRFEENLNFLLLEIPNIMSLKEFLPEKERKERAKQIFSLVHRSDWSPNDVSSRLHSHSGNTYLTQIKV